MDNEKKRRRSGEVIEDIILEILSRVIRVETLLRFRCVSKSWRSLIDSEFFINRHLHHATRNTATLGHSLVLYTFVEAKPATSNCCVLGCYLDDPTSVSRDIIDPLNSHLMQGHIGCHCNGMLLLLKEKEQVFLWNPSASVSTQLPDLGYDLITKCGVGWDQQSGVYKVFASGFCGDHLMANVYSTKTKSWRRIEGGFGCYSLNATGAYAGGRVHWLVLSEGWICMEWWEVRSEVFGRIELPCRVEEQKGLEGKVRLWLWERAGYIHLVNETHDFTGRTIWVLEEEKKGSWSWLLHPNSQLPTTIRASQTGAFSIIPTLVKP